MQRLIASPGLAVPAIRAAAKINDPELANVILNHYGAFNKSERSLAIDFFVARRSNADVLLRAMEHGTIAATDVSASQSRQIDALNDRDLSQRLQQTWGTVRRSPAQLLRQIRDLERNLDPSRIASANPSHGREIFLQTYAACHKLFGEGKTIGPELTGANRRDLHYLVSNIVDPSAAVPSDFRLSVVLTTDGRVISGAIRRRTDASVPIQTADESIELKSDEIDSIKLSTKSLMPDGLIDKLSGQQIQDLFAWIMSDG